jgi:hypothetical protein
MTNQHHEDGWRAAFPHFESASMPDAPEDFRDTSWRNDTCPSFTSEKLKLKVWIDHTDRRQREWPDDDHRRFLVERINEDGDNVETLLQCDEWREVLDLVERERGLK